MNNEEKDKFEYKNKIFDNYKTRIKLEIISKQNNKCKFDIYTTNPCSKSALKYLKSVLNKDIIGCVMTNVSTKKQDVSAIDLVSEFLKDKK